MVVCRNCATQLPDNALYCMHCGSRIAAYAPEETRAYVEELTKANHKAPVKLPKRDLGTIRSKVVGVTHDNDDGSSRQTVLTHCRAGEHLALKHQPVDQDENAVAVYRLSGEQVGWLSRELAADIAPYLDTGARIDVTATEITGVSTAGRSLGCNIAIAQIR